MTTFIIIVAVLAIIIFAGRQNSPTKKTSGQNNSTNTSYRHSVSDYSPTKTSTSKPADNLPTVADLVKSVNTIEEFARFEKKYEEVEKLFAEDFDNKQNEKLYRRYENAFAKISNKLSDKIFYYQYVPQIDLDTPLKILSRAYTTVSADEFKDKKKGTDKLDWQEITGNELMGDSKLEDSLEKKPVYFDALLKFREIVESKNKSADKSALITALIADNPEFKNEYFKDNDLQADINHYSKNNA